MLEKSLTLITKEEDKDQHIFYGIVYEPDITDAQGDIANAQEIQKACYHFMEHSQTFLVKHKGDRITAHILENYLAPVDFEIEKHVIKQGAWVLALRILDNDVWEAIKKGELAGYSMAGIAHGTDLTKGHRVNGRVVSENENTNTPDEFPSLDPLLGLAGY